MHDCHNYVLRLDLEHSNYHSVVCMTLRECASHRYGGKVPGKIPHGRSYDDILLFSSLIKLGHAKSVEYYRSAYYARDKVVVCPSVVNYHYYPPKALHE